MKNILAAAILSEYNQSEPEFSYNYALSNQLLSLLILFLVSLVVLEFSCYIFIYKECRNNARNMSGILSLDIVKKGIRTSMISFGGQVLIFASETLTQLFIILRLNFLKKDTFSYLPQLLALQLAVVSVFQIIAAPEIRRYLKAKYRL